MDAGTSIPPSSASDTAADIAATTDVPIAQCPVAHAASQPLPPGNPQTKFAVASSLKPPTDPRCVFFRTYEDLSQTPPLSRAASVQLDEIKKSFHNRLEPEQTSSVNPDTTIVLASRNSQLALVQTSHVSAMLTSHFGKYSPAFIGSDPLNAKSANGAPSTDGTPPESPRPSYSEDLVEKFKESLGRLSIQKPIAFPFTSMSTGGDQNSASPLYVIGGEGRAIWTKELEVALAGGAVDAIVHCLKDVPTTLPDGMMLGAILEREDPRDALIIKKGLPYTTLDELPPGSVIGTSSIRRVAQLRRRYPDLVFSDVRGNLITRLSKLDNPTGPYTALVLAAAGLIRLNLGSRISAFLSAPVMMHAVGQGSLTIEVRRPPPGATPETNRDARILAMVQAIGDWRSTWRQEAERSLLRELEGGCSIPVGVECQFDDHEEVEGLRNEQTAIRQVDIENGEGHLDQAPVVRNGHTIPASQLKNDSKRLHDDRPSPLKRLATDRNVNGGGHQEGTDGQSKPSTAGADGTGLPPVAATSDGSATAMMNPEDRATAPSEPIHLTLTAMVVSLDGARHSQYSLRKAVSSVDDARQLGIEVAQELAHKRGARIILDEVERHRRLAEAADDRRRLLEKQKRVRAAAAAHLTDNAVGESDEERENRRQLEELLKKSIKVPATVQSHGLSSTQADQISLAGVEVDRRGLARDDGQPKAWEV